MKELKITLIDRNKDLCKEWEKEFTRLPVEIINDDFRKHSADAIVSPANSFGYMDGGMDLALSRFFNSDRYVSIEDEVKEIIHNDFYGELLVGQSFVCETYNTSFPYLIVAPTTRTPNTNVGNSINAYLAMKSILTTALNNNNINSVMVTGLCSCIGKMSLNMVAKQMSRAYEKVLCDSHNFDNWSDERGFELDLKK